MDSCRGTCCFIRDNTRLDEYSTVIIVSFIEDEFCETVSEIASSYGFGCLNYYQDIVLQGSDGPSGSVDEGLIHVVMYMGYLIKKRYPDLSPIGVIASRKRLLKMNAFFPLMPPEESKCKKYFLPIDISSIRDEDVENHHVQSLLIKYSDFIQHVVWERENPYVMSRVLEKFLDANVRDVPLLDTFEMMKPLFDRKCMYAILDEIAQVARNKNALPVRSATWELVSQRTVKTLACPYIVKSRLACGTQDAHLMGLILRREGVTECELADPLVAQEYINHDGILFKVYVVGTNVMVERRSSMPDIYLRGLEKDKMEALPSCIEFDSLHSLPTRLPWLENGVSDLTRTPSFSILTDYFFEQLANIVRERISLSVFGFDVVFDRQAGEVLLLDINYLPSFGGISDAPSYFIDTFLS